MFPSSLPSAAHSFVLGPGLPILGCLHVLNTFLNNQTTPQLLDWPIYCIRLQEVFHNGLSFPDMLRNITLNVCFFTTLYFCIRPDVARVSTAEFYAAKRYREAINLMLGGSTILILCVPSCSVPPSVDPRQVYFTADNTIFLYPDFRPHSVTSTPTPRCACL
jgi:hypothetical protein